MPKARIAQNVSVISALLQSRAKIFADAEADSGRALTEPEMGRVAALESVIVHADATHRGDAAIQIAVAFEQMERCRDGVGGADTFETVYAALRSANATLNARRAA